MAKLRVPSISMKIRKPLGLSERFGVSTAEKIVGSGSRSAFMPPNIGQAWRGKHPRRNHRGNVPQKRSRPAPLSRARNERAGKAALVEGTKSRGAADQKALMGAVPQWTPGQIFFCVLRTNDARATTNTLRLSDPPRGADLHEGLAFKSLLLAFLTH